MAWKNFVMILIILLRLVFSKMSGPPRLFGGGYQMHHICKTGDNIKLHCPLETSFQPPPLISWHKDDETIHLGWNRIKTSDHDKILRIKDLEISDSGVYICKATNGFGSVEAKHLLYVYGNSTTPPGPSFNENIFENLPGKEIRPKFLHSSKMESYVMAPPGGTIHLPCESTGRPRPEILWYYENRQLFQEDLNGLAGESVKDLWRLKISSIKEKQGGRYTCKLFNSAGSLNFTFYVRVAASSEGPEFLIGHLENKTAYYGHHVSFECVVRSNSVPLLQWLKPVPASSETKFLSSASTNNTVVLNNQRYLILQGSISSNEDIFSNTLTISSVHQYDYGMYICSVASNQGLLHKSVFLLPHSDELTIKNEAQLISPGYYFIFGIIVSLSITVLIIFVTVIICCKKTSSFKQKDVADQIPAPGLPNSCGQQTSHQSQILSGTSVQGAWQASAFYPQQSMDNSTPDVASNFQVYFQPNGPLSITEDNQGVLKAHHYSLISGSSASHQTPPSIVSASSSQKHFFYRPPFRQQQLPLLNHATKD